MFVSRYSDNVLTGGKIDASQNFLGQNLASVFEFCRYIYKLEINILNCNDITHVKCTQLPFLLVSFQLIGMYLPKRGSSAQQAMFFSLLTHCGRTSEECMIFHSLLPKVFALISIDKIELNRILVISLRLKSCKR